MTGQIISAIGLERHDGQAFAIRGAEFFRSDIVILAVEIPRSVITREVEGGGFGPGRFLAGKHVAERHAFVIGVKKRAKGGRARYTTWEGPMSIHAEFPEPGLAFENREPQVAHLRWLLIHMG